MIINHNLPALNTYNKLVLNNSGMAKSLEKLSSGLRINRAADDAAGLAISEKMRSQIRGLDQASRNAQDGISLIQTAEGALQETHSILQRMRELSVQAANDTYTSEDRQQIQKEIDQLTSEVDRIAGTTQFNGKYLLNGDTAAYVSSDKLTTKIFMRDGLAAGSGNYKLDIEAIAGQNEVQKTDIFKVKTDTISSDVIDINNTETNMASEANGGISVSGMMAGSYEVTTIDNSAAVAVTLGTGNQYYQKDPTGTLASFEAPGAATDVNSSTMFTVVNKTLDSVTLSIVSHQYKTDGTYEKVTSQITISNAATTAVVGTDTSDVIGLTGLSISLQDANDVSIGDKFVVNMTATAAASSDGVTIGGNGNEYTVMMDKDKFDNKTTSIKMFSVDSVTGSSYDSEVSLKFDDVLKAATTSVTGGLYAATASNSLLEARRDYTQATAVSLIIDTSGEAGSTPKIDISATTATNSTIKVTVATGSSVKDVYDALMSNSEAMKLIDIRLTDTAEAAKTLAETTGANAVGGNGAYAAKFDVTGQAEGDLAMLGTKLSDIDKFYDDSGNFILEQSQTITLVQGDGSKATVTISGSDTIKDVRDKLNAAIGDGLGQAAIVGGGGDFVSFVEQATADDSGLESVAGTFVIRSAIAGNDGKIAFVGDDDVLAALSLSTIQEAENNNYIVDVTNAHTGEIIADGVKISENNLVGVVDKNVDVQFAANTGIKTTWDSDEKNFNLSGGTSYKEATYVHLADNTMVFQIGANQHQEIATGIGNMGAEALGVNNIQVTNNDLANEAIGKLDSAINRVSSERSKLGALQNRLDHTINNLSTTSENLTAAESRIRDVDMAKEMMNFTKYQVLANAATAMLAQANQLPQSVLQLLR